jgi:glycosyltransferase involved in cell wall biosynthesis
MVVLPFLPSPAFRSDGAAPVDVRTKYGLSSPYVFYPAQLWPHKNHRYILDGLRLLSDRHGVDLDAVFVGSDKGNGVFLRRKAYELGIGDRVHFLGFLPQEDIPSLYAEAFALVMPTYFGPTNIPPLEGFAANCPVIYSDLPDFRAEMGDAVLYCDLRDPLSLAEHLLALRRDPALAERLRQAGRRVLARIDEPAYAATLGAVFDRYDEIRRRWTD